MGSFSTNNFVIDLNYETSFFGLKNLKDAAFADWGINACNGKGCTTDGVVKKDFSYWPTLYPDLQNINYVDANIVLRLNRHIAFNENSPTLPIKLLGSTQLKSPFTEGSIGAIGLAPNGAFIQYLKKAYTWNDDQITFQIDASKLDSKSKGFSNQAGIFSMNTISFALDLFAPMIDLDIKPPELNSKKMVTLNAQSTKWTMPQVTMTVAKKVDSNDIFTIIDKKDLCFTPRVNNFFTFYNHQTYLDFTKMVYNSICGKDDSCPSGSKQLNVAPIRVILNPLVDPEQKVTYPYIYLMPQDYIHDDGKKINIAVDSLETLGDNMKSLFTAQCGIKQGDANPSIAIALGRQFFNRVKVDFQIGVKDEKYKIGFEVKDYPEEAADFRVSMILLVILAVSVLGFLLSVIFKKKQYQEVSRAAMATQEEQKIKGF